MNEVHASSQLNQSIELWAAFLQQQEHAVGTRKRYLPSHFSFSEVV